MARRIQVTIEGDSRDIRREARRSRTALMGIERQARQTSSQLRTAFAGVGVAIAALVGRAVVSGFRRLIEDAAEFGDQLVQQSRVIGLTVEQLQELRFAATQVGLSVQGADVGLQRFARRLGEAAQGTGVLSRILTENDIAIRNQDNTLRGTREVLSDYADLIRNASSENEQLRLAFAGFDTEGARFVNALRGGAEALELAGDRARELGILTTESAQSLAEVQAQVNELSTVLRTQLAIAIAENADGIRALAEVATRAASAIGFLGRVFSGLTSGGAFGPISGLVAEFYRLDDAAEAADATVSDLDTTITEFAATAAELAAETRAAAIHLVEINQALTESSLPFLAAQRRAEDLAEHIESIRDAYLDLANVTSRGIATPAPIDPSFTEAITQLADGTQLASLRLEVEETESAFDGLAESVARNMDEVVRTIFNANATASDILRSLGAAIANIILQVGASALTNRFAPGTANQTAGADPINARAGLGLTVIINNTANVQSTDAGVRRMVDEALPEFTAASQRALTGALQSHTPLRNALRRALR